MLGSNVDAIPILNRIFLRKRARITCNPHPQIGKPLTPEQWYQASCPSHCLTSDRKRAIKIKELYSGVNPFLSGSSARPRSAADASGCCDFHHFEPLSQGRKVGIPSRNAQIRWPIQEQTGAEAGHLQYLPEERAQAAAEVLLVRQFRCFYPKF